MEKKCCHYIYLIKDEVVDKVPEATHDSHQTLTNKNINHQTNDD